MAGEKGATQEGVQNRETGHVDESEERELTPREEALRDVARTRKAALAAEIVEGGGAPPTFDQGDGDDDDDDREAEPQRRADPPPPPPSPARAAAAPPAAKADETNVDEQLARQAGGAFAGDPKTTMFKVKVDGEEMELPLERIVANYQKSAAADKRLEEATRLLAEARAEKESGGAPAAAPTAADPPKTDFRKVTAAMFEGDDDAAVAAFEQAVKERVDAAVASLGRGNATPVDETRIAASVRQQIVEESALAESKARYPKLYTDPDMHQLGRLKIERRMAEGIPFVDALNQVQDEMAASFAWKEEGRETTKPANRDLNDRLERKRNGIERVPTASARRAGEAEPEPIMDERDRAQRGIAYLMKTRPGQAEAA